MRVRTGGVKEVDQGETGVQGRAGLHSQKLAGIDGVPDLTRLSFRESVHLTRVRLRLRCVSVRGTGMVALDEVVVCVCSAVCASGGAPSELGPITSIAS